MFMDGRSREIRAADWDRFIADQEKAWDAIRKGEELPPIWVPEY
jgi:hypothetical protein